MNRQPKRVKNACGSCGFRRDVPGAAHDLPEEWLTRLKCQTCGLPIISACLLRGSEVSYDEHLVFVCAKGHQGHGIERLTIPCHVCDEDLYIWQTRRDCTNVYRCENGHLRIDRPRAPWRPPSRDADDVFAWRTHFAKLVFDRVRAGTSHRTIAIELGMPIEVVADLYAGASAANAFEMFEAGKSVADVMHTLGLDIAKVQELHGYFVSPPFGSSPTQPARSCERRF